jgi:hypothetical protein
VTATCVSDGGVHVAGELYVGNGRRYIGVLITARRKNNERIIRENYGPGRSFDIMIE